MAGVVFLDIADDIRIRLGQPTVTALARRFGPDGRCLTCGKRFGAVPLSVRAYRGNDGIITLVAYHADCAVSAWIDFWATIPLSQGTWAAAATSARVQMPLPRWLHRIGRPATRPQVMPVLLVHPCLEWVRVRQAAFGEAVNADFEAYGRLGFHDPSVLARTWPLRPAGGLRSWEPAQMPRCTCGWPPNPGPHRSSIRSPGWRWPAAVP